MNKPKNNKNNVLKFPSNSDKGEREVEAILFAAAEPLNIDTIESKISKKINVLKTLKKLAATKTQLIYVTHHVDEILPLTTHVLFLKNGTIFSKGTKGKMLTGSHLSEAFDCHIELKKTSGRYWITESRPNRSGDPIKHLN